MRTDAVASHVYNVDLAVRGEHQDTLRGGGGGDIMLSCMSYVQLSSPCTA